MNKDIYLLLIEKLSDKNLLNLGRSGKYFYNLFESEILWKNRIRLAFRLERIECDKLMTKMEFESYKSFYKWIMEEYVRSRASYEAKYKYAYNAYYNPTLISYLKENSNLDIDFSIMFDSKKTVLPNFIDRKLFVKDVKRYIYMCNGNTPDKIFNGYSEFYDRIMSNVVAGAVDSLYNIYKKP